MYIVVGLRWWLFDDGVIMISPNSNTLRTVGYFSGSAVGDRVVFVVVFLHVDNTEPAAPFHIQFILSYRHISVVVVVFYQRQSPRPSRQSVINTSHRPSANQNLITSPSMYSHSMCAHGSSRGCRWATTLLYNNELPGWCLQSAPSAREPH